MRSNRRFPHVLTQVAAAQMQLTARDGALVATVAAEMDRLDDYLVRHIPLFAGGGLTVAGRAAGNGSAGVKGLSCEEAARRMGLGHRAAGAPGGPPERPGGNGFVVLHRRPVTIGCPWQGLRSRIAAAQCLKHCEMLIAVLKYDKVFDQMRLVAEAALGFTRDEVKMYLSSSWISCDREAWSGKLVRKVARVRACAAGKAARGAPVKITRRSMVTGEIHTLELPITLSARSHDHQPLPCHKICLAFA
jgi:hypothetical protein